jgi:hypothetical protein
MIDHTLPGSKPGVRRDLRRKSRKRIAYGVNVISVTAIIDARAVLETSVPDNEAITPMIVTVDDPVKNHRRI